MRYGIHVHNSKATAEILLAKAVAGNVIWSNATVKGLLQDIITLHGEVEHERKEKDAWRIEATTKHKKKVGW